MKTILISLLAALTLGTANAQEPREHVRRDEPRVEQRTEQTVQHTERTERKGPRWQGDRITLGNGRGVWRHHNHDRNDVHFRIGVHSHDWYIQRYHTIEMIDGCPYYKDGGCWFPAFGAVPGCTFRDNYMVYCEE
jgi:hypothetical protein